MGTTLEQSETRTVQAKTRLSWGGPFLAALICIACLLPFVGKAFTIDDPLFIWAAKHIQKHPADPYGFIVNWYATPMEMSYVTKNPPVACYYLALVSALFGFSEMALHLAFLLPAAGAAWGTYRLAEQLCARPLLATLAMILTPVFLVSSTNVMCDTMMLCFWVWAIVCWQRGFENPVWLGIAAVLICLCALTKYFGMSLIPLLLAYTIAGRKPLRPALLALAIPVAVLIAYQLITSHLYGEGLLSDAAGFSMNMRTQTKERSLTLLIGLAFTGGCVACVLFYFPLLWSWRVMLGGIGLTIGLLAAPWLFGHLGFISAYSERDWTWQLLLQFGILVLGGIGVVALALVDLRQARDAAAWLLFLWTAGTIAFAVGVNWVINGRSLLPLAPVAGILVVRQLDRLYGPASAGWHWKLAWPLVPSAALALVVAAADQQQANADRDAAMEISALTANQVGTLWLQGHWGFQYYLEELGGRHTDFEAFQFQPGDFLVWPENNYGLFFDSHDKRWSPIQEYEPLSKGLFPGLTTLSSENSAGFYSHGHGPLPFAFGPQPNARYRILRFGPKDTNSDAPVK